MNTFVAQQDLGLDGQLYCNTFDGETWAGYQQVPNVVMSGSPSAVPEGGHVNALVSSRGMMFREHGKGGITNGFYGSCKQL